MTCRLSLALAAVLLSAGFALAQATAPATSTATASAPAASKPESNKLTVTGKLTTGMMAIGGETTGITIQVSGSSYELDIKDAVLRNKAQGLSGKEVTVTGTLTIKQGVEVAQRRIITVETLEAAAPAAQPK